MEAEGHRKNKVRVLIFMTHLHHFQYAIAKQAFLSYLKENMSSGHNSDVYDGRKLCACSGDRCCQHLRPSITVTQSSLSARFNPINHKHTRFIIQSKQAIPHRQTSPPVSSTEPVPDEISDWLADY